MYGLQVSAFTIKDGVWSETVMAKRQLGRRFNLRNNVLFLEKTTHKWSHKLEKTQTHTHWKECNKQNAFIARQDSNV